MQCKKCSAAIPDGSLFCNICGKKQIRTPKARCHKRAHGTGTISKDGRCKKNPYIVHAPSTPNGAGRIYIGAYPDYKSAQIALEDYIRNGRPTLYNATLGDIYKMWSAIHYKRVSQSAVDLYSVMWKRFSDIKSIKMVDIKTTHFQEIVNRATSRSAANTLKVMAIMLCKHAMENDVISKNYAEFIKLPKFEKKEKKIFTAEQIETLWKHSDDKRVQVILAMIYMGFRIGELVMMTPADINFDEGYVVTGEKTEAGKNRVIPFPPAIPEIKLFFTRWCEGIPCDQQIFSITITHFRNKMFYSPLVELGFVEAEQRGQAFFFYEKNHLTPHSTRHTFASLSAAAGMRPEELQKIIGHANYAVTADVYIHKDISSLKEAMTSLKR